MSVPVPARPDRSDQKAAAISAELRFATRRLGWLLPVVGIGSLFFAFGAARLGSFGQGR